MAVKEKPKKEKKPAVLIGGFIEVVAYGDGSFFFNEPSNHEWSEWRKAINVADTDKDYEAEIRAYGKLFDQTFEKAVNLEINNSAGKTVKFDKDSKRFMSDRDKKEVVQAGFVLRTRFSAAVIKN